MERRKEVKYSSAPVWFGWTIFIGYCIVTGIVIYINW